jgi:Ca2+-binding RTX toxin-like protein
MYFSIENLAGTNLDDTLHGNSGNNFLRGNAGADTFVFKLGDGHDTIEDFSTAAGPQQDSINIADFGMTEAALQDLINAQGASDTLNFGNGVIVTFTGIVVSDLDPNTHFIGLVPPG